MKTRIYGALLIVFMSGLSIGFFVGQYVDRAQMHHLMRGGPVGVEAMITGRLVRHLDLDGAQTQAVRAKVGVVIKQADAEFRRQGDTMRVRMTTLLAEIRPLLNASQQALLDRMDADDLRPGPPPGEGRGGPPSAPPPQDDHKDDPDRPLMPQH